MASSIQIQSAQSIPGVYGNLNVNVVVSVSTPLGLITSQSISTNSSVTVPSGATTVTIIPPSTNSNALTFKGVSGDTGVSMSLTNPTQFSLAAGVSTFVINAASATILTFVWN